MTYRIKGVRHLRPRVSTDEARRLAAESVRHRAWIHVQPLILQRRYAEAARRMREACREAWNLEQPAK